MNRPTGTHRRLLVRGEAGSGKTTLLKWLAVTASRGGFTGVLESWNGLIPYLIKLRSHAGTSLPRPDRFLDGVADHDVDLMPRGWVHRRLDAGAALLLVDGVDELTRQERPRVREWLRLLLRRYPETKVVVTSRPAAAGSSWLQDEGFGSAALERMSPADVRRFVAHWHDAVRQAGGLPCEEAELPRYESALLARLESNPHMAVLATTPLLCAMLCALNLDRRTHLPRDRMGIYRAALELLVERREVDRAIPSYHTLIMETADKLHLLRHLAWRMTVNNRAEAVRSDAELWIADKLRSIPRLDAGAATVLSHLVERSGLLREPVLGRIDFVHRSLQEYLAAVEAAEQSDLGLLVDRAHLDQWHDTIVMAAGAAHVPVRRRLIEDLERRSIDEPHHARTIRLLIARCAETMTAPEPAVLSTVERCCAALLPPRSMRETRSLAGIGEPLLHHMPANLLALSGRKAAATVRTVALINGPQALEVLARWADDPRPAVQRELADCWKYFDPAEYAARVLADAPLDNGHIRVSTTRLLPHVSALRRLTSMWALVKDPSQLDGLSRLTGLSILQSTDDLSFLSRHPSLEDLALHVPPGVSFEALNGLRALRSLFLIADEVDPRQLSAWLERLHLLGRIDGGLPALADSLPNLRELQLSFDADTDFSPLTRMSNLDSVVLNLYDGSHNLAPLTGIASLRTLTLGNCSARDLDALRGAKFTVRVRRSLREALGELDGQVRVRFF